MVKATKIEITFSEAGSRFCGSFTTWAAANDRLGAIHRQAPKDGSYDKTDFRITWENGDTYEGRIDVTGNEYPWLDRHVRDFCEFYSGRRRPYHRTAEQWTSFLEQVTTPEKRAEIGRILDEYQIGDDA